MDRFDYMARDPQMVGIHDYKFDFSMYFENFTILNDQVVFNQKMAFRLNDLFHNRYRLFKHVYGNRTSSSFELLMGDILVNADKKFNFLDKIYKPEEYVKLHDGIRFDLLRSKNPEVQK